MSTVLEVLTVAYRRSGVLPAGRQVEGIDLDIGVEFLVSCFKSWFHGGMFGQLVDTLKEGEGPYEAKEQQWVKHLTADTITLPTQVLDAGEYRKPKNGAIIALTDTELGTTTRYIYDGSKSDWMDISAMTQPNDYVVLTETYDMAIKTMFAVYLADENGLAISPALAKQYAMQKMAFVGKFGQDRRRDVGSFY